MNDQRITQIVVLGLISVPAVLLILKGLPVLAVLGYYALIALSLVLLLAMHRDIFDAILLWFFLVLFDTSSLRVSFTALPGLSVDRGILFIILCLLGLYFCMGRVRFLRATALEKIMVLFVIYCIMTMILGVTFLLHKSPTHAFGDLSYGYAIPFLMFFLGRNLISDRKRMRKVLIFFCLTGVYLGMTAVFEAHRLHALIFPRFIDDPSVGIHWGRARGPFLNAAVDGTVLGVVILITLYLFVSSKKFLAKFLYSFAIFIMLIGLFYTKTRACWLAVPVVFVYIYSRLPRLRKYIVTGMLVCFTAGLLWMQFSGHEKSGFLDRLKEQSHYSRINLLVASWNMFLERPLFGFGFDSFAVASPKYFARIGGIPVDEGQGLVPHNVFAGALAELGLVGLLLLLWIYVQIYKGGASSGNRSGPAKDKELLVFFRGMFLVYLINALFIDMRFFLFQNSMVFLMAGLTARACPFSLEAEKFEVQRDSKIQTDQK